MSAQTIAPASLIPIARPSIGESELSAVLRPLSTGWLTQGPEVAAFEQEFAAFVGASHACAVSNCTTALHLALRAAGVGTGDEVITVSHSFIASANAVRYCGAVPVFVDVQPDTYNMDPLRIEAVISERTRAILAVHQLGMPCDLDAVIAIARRRGLLVIEDAACAAGSEICWRGRWETIGRPHGDIACFSFIPGKVITTGDGGMLTTGNPEWDRQFRLWRQHSMTVSDAARHQCRDIVFEQYSELGFNYRLTDLQASIGRAQLARLPAMVAERRRLARRYTEALAGLDGLQLPVEPDWAKTNWQSYCVRLPRAYSQVRIMQAMLDAGIATRRGVMCAHREPAYRIESWQCEGGSGVCECGPASCAALIESETITAHSLILPLYVGMTDDDQARVAATLATARRRGTMSTPLSSSPRSSVPRGLSEDEIRTIVLDTMRTSNLSRDAGSQLEIAPGATIFGPGSPLDSLGLVALLLDLEDELRVKGFAVTLSDERAMSQKRSPFRTVTSLVAYIASLREA